MFVCSALLSCRCSLHLHLGSSHAYRHTPLYFFMFLSDTLPFLLILMCALNFSRICNIWLNLNKISQLIYTLYKVHRRLCLWQSPIHLHYFWMAAFEAMWNHCCISSAANIETQYCCIIFYILCYSTNIIFILCIQKTSNKNLSWKNNIWYWHSLYFGHYSHVALYIY